jgi:toxin YoeB
MNETRFSPDGWADYMYWLDHDKKMIKRINELIREIIRCGPLEGKGKPEALRHIKAYSRRIDDQNRLVYDMLDGDVRILACRGHYEDK